MKLQRRDFLKKAGLAGAAGMLPWSLACSEGISESDSRKKTLAPSGRTWDKIRADFELDPEKIHMACLLLASHPSPVREAIATYRKDLDKNPAMVQKNYTETQVEIRKAASGYMNVEHQDVALTDSTTMGIGLLINGLEIGEDQEMLTSEYDYFATHRAIELKAQRSGASFRKVPIYDDIHSVSEEEIVDKLTGEINPNTRLVTGTWVHSATGLKIPIKKIAERIAEMNRDRDEEDRIIFFVDGVHGFGVESTNVGDLGCDLFTAGTHKWMFGPRGTGVIWGSPEVQGQVSPTIPTFSNDEAWGGEMTPGGFKAFEHQWALNKAFEYHTGIGKEQVEKRVHGLARQLKEGLDNMDHIRLHTPMDENLSSGIVCFEVEGMNTKTVVNSLAFHDIVGSATPYNLSYPRLAPGIYNTPEEIEEVLRIVRGLS